MAQENNILCTIKEKDFKKYAKRWFKKELQNTAKQIDNCLAKVQELKMAKDAYPPKGITANVRHHLSVQI